MTKSTCVEILKEIATKHRLTDIAYEAIETAIDIINFQEDCAHCTHCVPCKELKDGKWNTFKICTVWFHESNDPCGMVINENDRCEMFKPKGY